MFAPRTAAGLTIALLALPASANAASASPGSSADDGVQSPALVQSNPDQRIAAPTSSLAGTTSPPISPDAADAARAGDIAKAMEHYQRSQPLPAAARPASPPQGGYRQAASPNDTPPWPEIAFTGVVLLAAAGGVVHVRMRRRRTVRVAA